MSDTIITFASWFPASALLPDGQVIHRARIYATDGGLKIFTQKPEDGVTAQWESPILFDQTEAPDMTVRNNGVDFHTEAGLVVVTPTGGCKCGGMSRWIPSWASHTAAWPTPSPA